ncbi:MAG: hypothetical protein ACFFD4_08895 [Candidatus Odinarchaeota archaeon]
MAISSLLLGLCIEVNNADKIVQQENARDMEAERIEFPIPRTQIREF